MPRDTKTNLGFCHLSACAAAVATPSRPPACTGERESRSPEPLVLAILYGRGRIRFLGSALRDCSSSSSRVAFHPSRAVLPTVVFNAVCFDPSSPSSTTLSQQRYCCDVICYTSTATSTRSVRATYPDLFSYGCSTLCTAAVHVD